MIWLTAGAQVGRPEVATSVPEVLQVRDSVHLDCGQVALISIFRTSYCQRHPNEVVRAPQPHAGPPPHARYSANIPGTHTRALTHVYSLYFPTPFTASLPCHFHL